MLDVVIAQDKIVLKRENNFVKKFISELKEFQSDILYELDDIDTDYNSSLIIKTLTSSFLRRLKDRKKIYFYIFLDIIDDARKMSLSHQNDLLEMLELNKIKKIKNVDNNLLENGVNTYLDKLILQTYEKYQSLIYNAFTNKQPLNEVKKNIKKIIGTVAVSLDRATHYIYQLSYNKANTQILKVSLNENPSLMKEWVSVLDNKTTVVCTNLDGQVKPIDEPFKDPDSGSLFMYPPAVYGNANLNPTFHLCRSRVIPHV